MPSSRILFFYGNEDAAGTSTLSIAKGTQEATNSTLVYNSIGEDNFSNISPLNLINTSNADPLFTDISSNDFSLQAGSSAIDAGDNSLISAGITTDLIGTNRIVNSIVDIGSYEYDPLLSSAAVLFPGAIATYPNPTKTVLHIMTDLSIENVVVYNYLGQKVLKSKQTQINTSTLATGMYLLKLYTTDGAVGVKRFVKE